MDLFALFLMSSAGALIGMNNCIFKKASESKRGVSGYLSLYYGIAGVFMIVISSMKQGILYIPSLNEILVGIVTGLLLNVVVFSFATALKVGSMPVTAAIFASASEVSSLINWSIFGSKFIELSWLYVVSSGLIIFAIFYPVVFYEKDAPFKKVWMYRVSLAFILHVAYMVFMTWRTHTAMNFGRHVLFRVMLPQMSIWIDGIAHAVASVLFFIQMRTEGNKISKIHIKLGIPSSIILAFAHLFLVFGLSMASPRSTPLLWPSFSASVIIFATVSGHLLLKEKFSRAQILLLLIGNSISIPFLI